MPSKYFKTCPPRLFRSPGECQRGIKMFVDFQKVATHPAVQTFSRALCDSQVESAQWRRHSLASGRRQLAHDLPYSARMKFLKFVFGRNDGFTASWIALPAAASE